MAYWFVVEIDRDFISGLYGNGPQLHTNLIGNQPGIFDLQSYSEINNGLKVVTTCNNTVELTGGYNKDKFEEYMKVYKLWDQKFGENMGDDRPDYQPFLYKNFNDLKNNLKKII